MKRYEDEAVAGGGAHGQSAQPPIHGRLQLGRQHEFHAAPVFTVGVYPPTVGHALAHLLRPPHREHTRLQRIELLLESAPITVKTLEYLIISKIQADNLVVLYKTNQTL